MVLLSWSSLSSIPLIRMIRSLWTNLAAVNIFLIFSICLCQKLTFSNSRTWNSSLTYSLKMLMTSGEQQYLHSNKSLWGLGGTASAPHFLQMAVEILLPAQAQCLFGCSWKTDQAKEIFWEGKVSFLSPIVVYSTKMMLKRHGITSFSIVPLQLPAGDFYVLISPHQDNNSQWFRL